VVTPVFDGHVMIYTVAAEGQTAQADPNGLVPVSIIVNAAGKDPAREAINALITSPHSAIPQGTKLLDIAIDPSTGVATLNFSSEFRDNFHGGDTSEAQVLNSVRETLGQFQNVQAVQFLVAGKKIDTLGGTEDLTVPLPTIRDEKEAASAG
jgi:spore germination protein GerM